MITCGALGSSLNFQAQAGIVYYLQLGSISGYTPDRNLTIHIEELTRPANDDFANAKLVADLPFNDGVDNSGATTEVGEPKPSCAPSMYKTVWYAFIPAASQRFTAYADAWFGKTFAVWTGSALFDLAEIGCRNSWYYGRLTFSAEAGKTYYIQIGSSEDYNSGWLNTGLDVTPSPVVGFWVSPGDPSIFDAVQFYNASYDPIEEGIKTMAWDFGDGATSSDWNPIHQYAKDGDYTVNLTVTTLDGRTASSQQVVPVKTHDVGITRIAAPTAAHAGQTRPIVVSIKNTRYPEDVRVELYKSTPTGFQGISDTVKTIPVRLGGRMTSVTFNYTFTAVDARMGKVTFKAVATLLNSRDVWPADNEAISVPTKVSK
jgi:PKD repeat protein